jgi:branched-chain amino acid aminotransferase
MCEVIYLNGKLLALSEIPISYKSPLLLSGMGLFETMRAYNGRIFLLERHLKRIAASAKVLGFPVFDKSELRDSCLSVLNANNLNNARLRLTVGVDSTVIARATAYESAATEKYTRGYRAVVSNLRRLSSSTLAFHKTTSRLDLETAHSNAVAHGYEETILLNEQGNITEGSITNLFFAVGGKLVTPEARQGLLPGITRQFVMELAERAGIKVGETVIGPAELASFDEAFATNSVIGIMPLASVADHGKPVCLGRGSVTAALQFAYSTALEEYQG